jgi:hypothetical protein
MALISFEIMEIEGIYLLKSYIGCINYIVQAFEWVVSGQFCRVYYHLSMDKKMAAMSIRIIEKKYRNFS